MSIIATFGWIAIFVSVKKLAQYSTTYATAPLLKSLYKSQGTLSLLSAGAEVRDQDDVWTRFVVIKYVHSEGKWVYSARRNTNNSTTSYLCQHQLREGLFKIY